MSYYFVKLGKSNLTTTLTKSIKNKMRFPVLRNLRLLKRWYFVVTAILVLVYLLISSILLQIVTRNSHRIVIKRTALNLPNVLMHLDLKGSPPKISYLESLLPKLQDLGVTGFLIEYEDMFPYKGSLVKLRAKNAYEKNELKTFLKLAVKVGFDIVPLIQTFGHMEFALKLKEFQHLREAPLYPDTICPSMSESQDFIKSMLKQVIKFHQDIFPIKYFHIGADEVNHINRCKQCLKRNQTNMIVFLNHVKAVTDMVKSMIPTTTVLIWEDMFHGFSMDEWETVRNLDIEPVYWDYRISPRVSHTLLRKYHEKFNNIWIASAFKGADGTNATFPNIKYRFLNHLNWLELIHEYKFGGEQHVYTFKGIILTGWSRYSHAKPLCELLPVSIPSLFLNLLLIKKLKSGINWVASNDLNDFFNKNLNDDITANLHCSDIVDIDYFDTRQCYFDGNDIYKILKYNEYFNDDVTRFIKEKSYVQYNNTNVTLVSNVVNWCNKIRNDLWYLENDIALLLSRYYDKHSSSEYANQKVRNTKKNIHEFCSNIKLMNVINVI